MSVLKKRKIIALISFGFLLLITLFGFLESKSIADYSIWAYKNWDHKGSGGKSNLILEKKSITDSFITSLLFIIFYSIWFIFLFIYLYSKNKTKINCRKWPYIVLIIFSSIFIIVSLVNFLSNYNSLYKISDEDLKKGNSKFVKDVLNKEYNNRSIIKVYMVLKLCSSALLLGLIITGLVLIKKQKNENDVEYSKSVLETGNDIDNKKVIKEKSSSLNKDLP